MMEKLLNAKQSTQVVEAIGKIYPSDKPELDYNNLFELVCAVTLSAQTTDVAVNKVTPALFDDYPIPQAMAEAPVEAIEEKIKTIGLYHNKAKYLKQMSNQLLKEFDGLVPHTREELMSLSGVGRKTANVVLSAGFNISAIAVDTHVKRVSQALKIVSDGSSVKQTEITLMEKLPENIWNEAHHYLISFGRRQCPARKHNHNECFKVIYEHLPKDAESAAHVLEKLIEE